MWTFTVDKALNKHFNRLNFNARLLDIGTGNLWENQQAKKDGEKGIYIYIYRVHLFVVVCLF